MISSIAKLIDCCCQWNMAGRPKKNQLPLPVNVASEEGMYRSREVFMNIVLCMPVSNNKSCHSNHMLLFFPQKNQDKRSIGTGIAQVISTIFNCQTFVARS